MSVLSAVQHYRAHQWRMVVLAAICFIASAPGQSFLVAVFVDDFLAGTGLSRTMFSGLHAAATMVSAAAVLAMGRLVDRRGLRAAWTWAAMALAVACGAASIATGAVGAFVALAMLRTFGQGSFPLVGTLIVARSFERRRGQAMAVANLGVTVASIALPPLTVALILAAGWRHAYQLIGLGLLVFVLPLAWLVRPSPPRPGQCDQDADHPRSFPAAMRRSSRLPTFTLPTRPTGQLLLILAAPPLIGTAVTFHAVSLLGERGLSFIAAGFALSILGGASAVGAVAFGVAADRVSIRVLLTALSLLVLAATAVLLAPGQYTVYIAFSMLGLGVGGTGVVNGTVWARTYGLAQIAKIQGTAQSLLITSVAVAPLVLAISHEAAASYTPGLLTLCGFAVLTSLTAVRWRQPQLAEETTAAT